MAAVFVVAWVRPAPGVVRLFASVALVGALMLGLMGWGLVRSIQLDTADQAVGAAIDETGATMCDCGWEHDPDELQVTDAVCERGALCDHSCATCRVRPQSFGAEGTRPV